MNENRPEIYVECVSYEMNVSGELQISCEFMFNLKIRDVTRHVGKGRDKKNSILIICIAGQSCRIIMSLPFSMQIQSKEFNLLKPSLSISILARYAVEHKS